MQSCRGRPSGDRAALYKTGSPGASGVRGRVSQLFSRRSASSARASQAWATLKRVSLSFAFIFSAIRTQSRANSRQVLESSNVCLLGFAFGGNVEREETVRELICEEIFWNPILCLEFLGRMSSSAAEYRLHAA